MDPPNEHLLDCPLPHRGVLAFRLNRGPVAVLGYEQIGAKVIRLGSEGLVGKTIKHRFEASLEVGAEHPVHVSAGVCQQPRLSLLRGRQGLRDHFS
jgi:hypothetical protein